MWLSGGTAVAINDSARLAIAGGAVSATAVSLTGLYIDIGFNGIDGLSIGWWRRNGPA